MASATGPSNRLAKEPSPYLRQHAHNPVDWWPWGDAAFAEARRRDVPVFLSIGYSTCHWCHATESSVEPLVSLRLTDGSSGILWMPESAQKTPAGSFAVLCPPAAPPRAGAFGARGPLMAHAAALAPGGFA